MESIRQAILRAKTQAQPPYAQRQGAAVLDAPYYDPGRAAPNGAAAVPVRQVALDDHHLQTNRIVAHNVTDPRARSFDILRTQLLQLMDQKKWRIVAVTSPTPACGKTVTALNLALSVARQPERRVLFIDMDFIKPMAAKTLGLEFDADLRHVLEGEAPLSRAVISVGANDHRMLVVPCTSMSGSAELIASRSTAALFQDIKRDFGAYTVILDLPPILSSDDVIALLPHVDCVLLVVAIGTSTIAQVEECKKHLQTAEVARVIVNKVPQSDASYYYY